METRETGARQRELIIQRKEKSLEEQQAKIDKSFAIHQRNVEKSLQGMKQKEQALKAERELLNARTTSTSELSRIRKQCKLLSFCVSSKNASMRNKQCENIQVKLLMRGAVFPSSG